MQQLRLDDYEVVISPESNDEWYTPDYIIKAVRACMGGIDLDPASTEDANKIVGAKKIFTKEDDGLIQYWDPKIYKRVWVNPPYSRGNLINFTDRFIDDLGNSKGIFLARYDSTTAWFQRMMESFVIKAMCLPKKKLFFTTIKDRKKKVGIRDGTVLFFRNIDPFIVNEHFEKIGYMCVV